MEDDVTTPQGEFHHFQLVNASGEVPLSISVLVHYNRRSSAEGLQQQGPITTDDIIELHNALESFDGDYISAFQA